MGSDNFCLKWNDFESNMSSSFTKLRQKSEFFDVTLSCDHGKSEIQAHKVILAACSPFFHRVLARNPHQNPLIYLKGVDYENLEAVINFMYQGEVNVAQEDLNGFLGVAQELAVKGLTDGNKNSNSNGNGGSGEKQPVKKLVKKPMPASAAVAAASGAIKRPPQLQPAPNLAAKQAPSVASPVPAMSNSPSASALISSSTNSPNVAKKPKLSSEEKLHVVKPDLESNLEEASPEEMEDYGEYGEGFEESAYLDESIAADEMEMGMGPGLDGDGTKAGFATVEDYITRNSQGTYWCKACGHHSSSRRDLSRHIEAKHMTGEYPCRFCDKVLNTKYNVQRHMNKAHRAEHQKLKYEMAEMEMTHLYTKKVRMSSG